MEAGFVLCLQLGEEDPDGVDNNAILVEQLVRRPLITGLLQSAQLGQDERCQVPLGDIALKHPEKLVEKPSDLQELTS
ncbi:hypothetical protein ACFY9S_05050 [Streptomyces sp. NPDC012474]|uniref:hypothetical protein n=1 Tax=Streptomyces sp. NPDC012474 TaxID=3364836 RepID=UPI0036ED5074